jgi:hypothetical protein
MRTRTGWLASLVVLAVMGSVAMADEEKVPLDKLPQKVTDAIKAKFPNAKLVAAEKEKEDGNVVYDVDITNGEDKLEVAVKEDGTITGYEKAIKVKDLPEAVTKALEDKYQKHTCKAVEEVYKVKDGNDEFDCYEIVIETAAKKKFELLVEKDGKIRKETEIKSKKKEDKKEDKDKN